MFRRWAEERIYRKTMKVAVAELRRAARTSNALEKLCALEVAEQRLKDGAWLRPERVSERYRAGLREIEESRLRTLREQAGPAVERLLAAAGEGAAEREAMLEAAGQLLALLNHYLPDEPQVQQLSSRFRELGGKQPPYQPVPSLAQVYHRPPPGVR